MRIAVVQMPILPSQRENMAIILRSLRRAKLLEADVAVFPECATYANDVTHATRECTGEDLAAIGAACRGEGVAAVVGTVVVSERGEWFNAVAVFDHLGEPLGVVCKSGLTDPERHVFVPGIDRPTFTLHGVRCTAIICREVEDVDRLQAQVAGDVRVVFWPGIMRVDERLRQQAATLARRLGVWLLQCNFATYLPDAARRGMGGSMVVSPDGRVAYACPPDEGGIAVLGLDPSSGEAGGMQGDGWEATGRPTGWAGRGWDGAGDCGGRRGVVS